MPWKQRETSGKALTAEAQSTQSLAEGFSKSSAKLCVLCASAVGIGGSKNTATAYSMRLSSHLCLKKRIKPAVRHQSPVFFVYRHLQTRRDPVGLAGQVHDLHQLVEHGVGHAFAARRGVMGMQAIVAVVDS